jgi:hypothetical protein
MASYRLRPMLWKGLGRALCNCVVRHTPNVRFGSLADMATSQRDVRFTPDNGHSGR